MKFPYKYHELIIKNRLITVVVLAWSLALLPFLFLWSDAVFALLRLRTVLPSILILIFCHTAVYLEARNQMRKIKTQQLSVEAKETFLKEKKALKTTTFILGTVLFSYVPMILLRNVLESVLTSPVILLTIESAFISIVLCNSVCYPLIYCARNSEFRIAFKKTVIKTKPCTTCLGT